MIIKKNVSRLKNSDLLGFTRVFGVVIHKRVQGDYF